MNPDDNFDHDRESHQGCIPIFPLPNYVPFPGIVQPLHIFEERYRRMMQDLLEQAHTTLVLAVLKPGWKEIYDRKNCPLYPVAVVGQIDDVEPLENGRFNLLWKGISRCLIQGECEDANEYRSGLIDIVEDRPSNLTEAASRERAWELIERFKIFRPQLAQQSQFTSVFHEKLPLSQLTDLIAFSTRLDQELVYPVLGECEVDSRSEKLLKLLRLLTASHAGIKYPYGFSEN